jgi:hypothetical protein
VGLQACSTARLGGMDGNFWVGLLLGFPVGVVASILASHYWEFRARWKAHKAAKRLVGTWTAYKLDGRNLSQTPMAGAGTTVVSLRSRWWSADAGVLDCESYDLDAKGNRRPHSGCIVMDSRIHWMATRIDRYEDSHEVAQQYLVMSRDSSVVYVFPIASGSTLGNVYEAHAWRRSGGQDRSR